MTAAASPPSPVLADPNFDPWLRSAFRGAQENSPVRAGAPLDPHGTSLRLFRQGRDTLAEIAAGAPITAGDSVQRLADLRAQELVLPAAEADPPQLSPLGEAVLDRWRALGVDNADGEQEAVRAVVVLTEAERLGLGYYAELEQRWAALQLVAPARWWLGRPGSLLLYSYLDRFDQNLGFNPWAQIQVPAAGDLSELEHQAWTSWADGLPHEPGWSTSRLTAFLRRLDVSRRSAGRQSFCVAMEAKRLAQQNPLRLVSELLAWELVVA